MILIILIIVIILLVLIMCAVFCVKKQLGGGRRDIDCLFNSYKKFDEDYIDFIKDEIENKLQVVFDSTEFKTAKESIPEENNFRYNYLHLMSLFGATLNKKYENIKQSLNNYCNKMKKYYEKTAIPYEKFRVLIDEIYTNRLNHSKSPLDNSNNNLFYLRCDFKSNNITNIKQNYFCILQLYYAVMQNDFRNLVCSYTAKKNCRSDSMCFWLGGNESSHTLAHYFVNDNYTEQIKKYYYDLCVLSHYLCHLKKYFEEENFAYLNKYLNKNRLSVFSKNNCLCNDVFIQYNGEYKYIGNIILRLPLISDGISTNKKINSKYIKEYVKLIEKNLIVHDIDNVNIVVEICLHNNKNDIYKRMIEELKKNKLDQNKFMVKKYGILGFNDNDVANCIIVDPVGKMFSNKNKTFQGSDVSNALYIYFSIHNKKHMLGNINVGESVFNDLSNKCVKGGCKDSRGAIGIIHAVGPDETYTKENEFFKALGKTLKSINALLIKNNVLVNTVSGIKNQKSRIFVNQERGMQDTDPLTLLPAPLPEVLEVPARVEDLPPLEELPPPPPPEEQEVLAWYKDPPPPEELPPPPPPEEPKVPALDEDLPPLPEEPEVPIQNENFPPLVLTSEQDAVYVDHENTTPDISETEYENKYNIQYYQSKLNSNNEYTNEFNELDDNSDKINLLIIKDYPENYNKINAPKNSIIIFAPTMDKKREAIYSFLKDTNRGIPQSIKETVTNKPQIYLRKIDENGKLVSYY
jgi:hypothetical protein